MCLAQVWAFLLWATEVALSFRETQWLYELGQNVWGLRGKRSLRDFDSLEKW